MDGDANADVALVVAAALVGPPGARGLLDIRCAALSLAMLA